MPNGEQQFELSPIEWWQLIQQYYPEDSAEYKAAEEVKKRLDRGEVIPRQAWPLYNILSQKHYEFYQFLQGLAPPPEQMTPYQEEQVALAKEKWGWQQRRWGEEQTQEALEFARESRQEMWGREMAEKKLALEERQQRGVRGLTGEQMGQLSAEFDVWKMRALQDPTLAGPAGWIRRYMIEQIPNPVAYEKLRMIHRGKVLRAGEEEKEAARFAKAGGGMWLGKRGPEQVSAEQAAGYAKEKRKATTRVGRREPTKPPTPTLPVAPAGLAEFVPGLVTGQPITKRQVETPSGQQWMATPWSQKEQLRGYMEWTGQPYEDIMGQMVKMLPEEPTGVRRKWYRPQRQWA